jgi:hypothetical protein
MTNELTGGGNAIGEQSMRGLASGLKVSVQLVMQGGGVAWLKLHCLKPSLLVVSPQVCAGGLKRTQR